MGAAREGGPHTPDSRREGTLAIAENACKALYGNLTVKNTRLRVMWARRGKARARDDSAGAGASSASASAMPPPPAVGGKKQPARPPPPGVRAPPGVKPAYQSMDPTSFDANPSAS